MVAGSLAICEARETIEGPGLALLGRDSRLQADKERVGLGKKKVGQAVGGGRKRKGKGVPSQLGKVRDEIDATDRPNNTSGLLLFFSLSKPDALASLMLLCTKKCVVRSRQVLRLLLPDL